MSANPSIEELVIDDSFVNYCLEKNEADCATWQAYRDAHPEETAKLEEAKQLVLGLTAMLATDAGDEAVGRISRTAKVVILQEQRPKWKKLIPYAAAAAVLLLLLNADRFFPLPAASPRAVLTANAKNRSDTASAKYSTGAAERKTVLLPDGSRMTLNAASSLTIDKKFGAGYREVYLVGEAMFDVVHNESVPFIVHTGKYDVKVLGTLFNVRDYPGDRQTETALIRGKVEIQIAASGRKILLLPNQKVVINSDAAGTKNEQPARDEPGLKMMPLTHDGRDSAVIETAWSQNRLEITDESFADMKGKLERWYNVKINLQDEGVSKYRFTATFEKETIRQVLQALQAAYHFRFEISGNEITIVK